MENKYANSYYWENLIKKDKEGIPFPNKPITEDSVFYHGVITNCHGDCYEQWLHFPNGDALLSFLYYVFFPKAFFAFLSNQSELLSHGNLDELLDTMKDSEKCNKKDLIPQMREFSYQLKKLWNYDTESGLEKLNKLSKNYEEQWNRSLELFSYFNVFRTPSELGQYMVDSYENSEMVDISMLEDQLGVTKGEWHNICSTVYENDFMIRKFTEILNNRIKDTL